LRNGWPLRAVQDSIGGMGGVASPCCVRNAFGRRLCARLLACALLADRSPTQWLRVSHRRVGGRPLELRSWWRWPWLDGRAAYVGASRRPPPTV